MDTNEKVKCADCGLLAGRVCETGETVQVDSRVRTEGVRAYIMLKAEIHCLVGAHRLEAEQESPSTPEPKLLRVVTLPRDCSRFRQWQPGFTPQEHIQMMQAELLRREIEERKQADERRAEERKIADEKRADERRAADKKEAAEQRAADKREAEARLANDRQWQKAQTNLSFYRTVALGICMAVFATILAILAEPWKSKSTEPGPPVTAPSR